jgi:tol-pal system protein YbgF
VTRTRLLFRPALAAAAALAVVSWAGASFAQEDFAETPNRRLDRIEKQLREVRAIVLQARATGAPVEIKEAGPDPALSGLTGRLDDMDQTLRNLTGQVETLQHDLAVARKAAMDAQAATASLADRVDKLEKQLAAMTAPPLAAQGGPPGPDGGLNGQAGGPPPPREGPSDPKAAYDAARQLLLNGDYKAASAAFQDYVDRYGDTANARSARYWLGETKFIQEDYTGAAVAYTGAIRGWPETAWAPDATVKLALSLNAIGRAKDACGALVEFRRHYPKASAAAKARAEAARTKAGCAAG